MRHEGAPSGSAVTRAKERGRQVLSPLAERVGLAPAGSADGHEVAQILADEAFGEKLASLAEELGRPERQVGAEAGAHLREMAATHSAGTGAAFRRFSQWLARAHDVYVDEDSIARLRALDRQHSLLFLFSHRSYLDGALVPEVVASRRMSMPFTFGGANLNFFPMGSIASRSGVIFIKRSTSRHPGLPPGAARLHRAAAQATAPTSPGRSRAAGPAPASSVRRRSASCGTSPTRSARPTGSTR